MEQRAPEDVTIEIMKMKHLDDVIEIEHRCFTNPWSRYAFACELRDNDFSRYIVAKVGDKIVGYGGMWMVLNEAHVTNVGVLPEYRGEGIGELIMRNLIEIARQNGADRMTLEVRKSNYVAQNLYSKLGFEPCGIRRGYYMDNREDAVIMWLEL